MARVIQKIDIFSHILPDKYAKALYQKAERGRYLPECAASGKVGQLEDIT